MATFFVIDGKLKEPEELFNTAVGAAGSLANLKDEGSVEISTDPIRSFKQIGIGKPLSIEIAAVYTGEYKKFLGGKKDIVVVSGVKNAQTFQSTSRAVNIKAENVAEHAFLKFDAFNEGTPIVFYTPAMDAESMFVSFEIMFDNFDPKLFEALSGLMNSAAGVPVFIPAAPYLLGGSQLLNIGTKLGDAIFSGRPNLADTIQIQFRSPIIPATEPREYVMYNDKDKAELQSLKVGVVDSGGSKVLRLVKADGSEYNGAAPYLIVLLNGDKREDLESFQPTIASAAVLKKFYGPQNQVGEITSALQDAMLLYNDSTYRAKGERLRKQIEKLSIDSEESSNLKTLYGAYAANIQTETLKLPDL